MADQSETTVTAVTGGDLLQKVTEKLHSHDSSDSHSKSDESESTVTAVSSGDLLEKLHSHDTSGSDSHSKSDESESTVTAVSRGDLLEKITEKLHSHDSSYSDSVSHSKSDETVISSVKEKIFRLFGRKKPVHSFLGGGKAADLFLWKNKKISAGALGVATAVWVLFELLEYHFVTLISHISILVLALLFLWSNAHSFINKTPPRIPVVHLPEEPFLQIASALRIEINRGFSALHNVGSGKDLKKFFIVIVGLWILSIVGSWSNFLTLFYITFVLLHTIPFLYDKYEDEIDPLAEKALIEIKKQYAVFEAKVLSQIPKGALKGKLA